MSKKIISKNASAGSLESNDALVSVLPGDGSINIEVHSIVIKQFGDKIKECAENILQLYNINNIKLHIQDMGALECTLKARIETAILRALEGDEK